MKEITFRDLKLKETLLSAIDDLGYINPSQIQAEAIPLAIEGYDIIGQAQTGTGKTAAFGCSIINNIKRGKDISSIILTPTRELAIQIYEELNKLSKYDKLKFFLYMVEIQSQDKLKT
jgi:ATP-dependent RNA helicase DeaD